MKDEEAKEKNKELLEALIPPKVPNMVSKVFNFIHENSNLVTSRGMDGVITGLNKEKLFSLANMMDIHLRPWYFALMVYENELLKMQKRIKKTNN